MHAPLVVFVIALIWRALLISLCNLCHKHAREECGGGRGVEEGLYERGVEERGFRLYLRADSLQNCTRLLKIRWLSMLNAAT